MMATARAVATPASPDISMPSQPSGLSSAKRLVPSPTILRNEVTELPGSSVAWATPFGNGVMIFIAASRGVRWSQFRTEITGTVASWSPERGLWFNPMGGVLLSGWGAAAIAWGLALRAEREFRCRFKWFCCRSSSWWGSPSPSCSGWPRRVAVRWRSGKPASRISRWVSRTGPTPPRSAIASATPKVLNDSRSAALRGHRVDRYYRRASSAWIMDNDTPRARVLGMLKAERAMDVDAIAALCDGGRFAPEPLSEHERAALMSRSTADAPSHIAGDYPEWLDGYLAQVFGDDRVAEATAMASRAPLDLRVNTLKAKREKMLSSLAHLDAHPTPWSPT